MTSSSAKLWRSRPATARWRLRLAAACSSKLKVWQKRFAAPGRRRGSRVHRDGEWMTSCMPPASSEEALDDEQLARPGSRPSEALAAARYSASCCAATAPIWCRSRSCAAHSLTVAEATSGSALSISLRSCDTAVESSSGAAGASPSQKGMVGAWPAASFHTHLAGFDAQDAIRGIAQLEHIAREALDGEVLVERADHDALRFQAPPVVGVLRDGAAAGDGSEPRAAPRTQPAVHRVTMQVGALAAAARGDAIGQHHQDFIEVGAR